jgi:protein-S-isoprenylcysteine O-methyltransferase Ste14
MHLLCVCINVLLFQHWIIILLGIPIIPFTYIDLVRAYKDLIEKFGDYYKAYTKEIPRANARATKLEEPSSPDL